MAGSEPHRHEMTHESGTVEMVAFGALYADLGEELQAAIRRVATAGHFVLGDEVADFERQLAASCGAQSAVGVGCGSDALVIALRASGVQPGDVVITSPLSFVASAEAILRCGAIPRFVDVEARRLTLAPAAVSAYLKGCVRRAGGFVDRELGAPVRMLLPVHLYGRVADMPALASIAQKAGLAMVQDGAQAVGAHSEGTPLTRFGPVCLSFFPTKNLGGWGDGGALLSDDAAVVARARRLRQHGRDEKGQYVELGYNSRLDALQAAVLATKLTHHAGYEARRRALVAQYDALLSAAGSGATATVEAPPPLRDGDTAHLYTVQIGKARTADVTDHADCHGAAVARAALRQRLREDGIGSAVYYPRLLCDEPAIRRKPHAADEALPQARLASQGVLSLPSHPFVSATDAERVIASLLRAAAD